jgi:alkanesulfonate monooxygenase SsuD/methylene tetrahydromethanopterin reductase-like flavin-dependent oxidoreductase (luciferase family)
MDLGIYTFGDLTPNPHSKTGVSPRERMEQMLALARFCDEAGLDIVGVGEHHSAQFVNSATATTIAAMAAITKRIRLTSATTLLSTVDPVRTFEEFATADVISNGRVELIFGRGAFTDNFPLFGFDLKDYRELFNEKLELFAALNSRKRVTWSGRFRAPLKDAEVSPRPVQPQLPVWIGAISPESVVRAATLGYPLAMPMIGGTLAGYTQLAALYRHTWAESGRPQQACRIAVYAHMYVASTMQQLRDEFFPHYAAYLGVFLKRPISAEQLAQMVSPDGAVVAGTPQQVVEKVLAIREAVGSKRFGGQMDIGGQPFGNVMRSMELYAALVAPAVRDATSLLSTAATRGEDDSASRDIARPV